MTAAPWDRKKLEGLLAQAKLMKLRTRDQALAAMAPIEERLVEMLAIEDWGEGEECRGQVEDFLHEVKTNMRDCRDLDLCSMPAVREPSHEA